MSKTTKTRVKTVEAVYTVSEYFDIPDDVYLLEESENRFDEKVYGSWYIRWRTLFYVDKELKIQEIESEDDITEQMKHPDKTFTDTTDENESEESDESDSDSD